MMFENIRRCTPIDSFEQLAGLLANDRFRAALLSDTASSGEFGFLDETITTDAASTLTRDVLLDGYQPAGNSAPPQVESTRQTVRAYLRTGICSFEFRRDFPLLLKRRGLVTNLLFHVHIQKCGGHALFALLKQNGYRVWHRRALAYSGFETYLRLLGKFLTASDRAAYLVGHYRLADLLPFVGPADPLVILIRDPIERALSMLNYIFTLFDKDPTLSRPDARMFAEMLGGKVRPQEHTLATLIEIPALQQYMMTQMSRMLAFDGCHKMRAMTATVIETSALQHWVDDRGERYGLRGAVTTENVSRKFFTPELVNASVRARLSLLMKADCALYDAMAAAIGKRGYREVPLSAIAVNGSAN